MLLHLFHHPWHQGKGVVTQQEIVQMWPSVPQGFRLRKPQSAILDLLRQLALIKKSVNLLKIGDCFLDVVVYAFFD